MTELKTFSEFVNEKKEGDDEAYEKFFNKALKKFGVDSPDELEGDKEEEFYDYVDKNWKADNEDEDGDDKEKDEDEDE